MKNRLAESRSTRAVLLVITAALISINAHNAHGQESRNSSNLFVDRNFQLTSKAYEALEVRDELSEAFDEFTNRDYSRQIRRPSDVEFVHVTLLLLSVAELLGKNYDTATGQASNHVSNSFLDALKCSEVLLSSQSDALNQNNRSSFVDFATSSHEFMILQSTSDPYASAIVSFFNFHGKYCGSEEISDLAKN